MNQKTLPTQMLFEDAEIEENRVDGWNSFRSAAFMFLSKYYDVTWRSPVKTGGSIVDLWGQDVGQNDNWFETANGKLFHVFVTASRDSTGRLAWVAKLVNCWVKLV